MTFRYKISDDPIGESVDQQIYQESIGSLLLLTASTPHIVFPTGLCARSQADPKVFHLATVKAYF